MAKKKKKIDPLREIINLNAQHTELIEMHDSLDILHSHAYYYDTTITVGEDEEVKVHEILTKIMDGYSTEMSINSGLANAHFKELQRVNFKH